MISINGQKMGKSLGNFITLQQLFAGKHELLQQAYDPMTIRFFILQAHYRSTLDFSNEALQSAEKGMQRLFAGFNTILELPTHDTSTFDVQTLKNACYEALLDDLNTPILISHLFVALKSIQSIATGTLTITEDDKKELHSLFSVFLCDLLGLLPPEEKSEEHTELLNATISMLLDERVEAKQNKNFAKSDAIRNKLTQLGVRIKDLKDGYEFEIQ